eukprot:5748603-Prymnesium_polylepis.1
MFGPAARTKVPPAGVRQRMWPLPSGRARSFPARCSQGLACGSGGPWHRPIHRWAAAALDADRTLERSKLLARHLEARDTIIRARRARLV